MHSANPPVIPVTPPTKVTQRTSDGPCSIAFSRSWYGTGAKMLRLRCPEPRRPTFTSRHSTNSTVMLRRIGLNHSSSGKITLHENMIQLAHQKCPKKRWKNRSRSYLLGPYQAQKNSVR